MTGLVDPGSARRTTHPVGTDDGSLPPAGRLARNLAVYVLGPVLIWLVLLASSGWLLSHPLKKAISGEDGLNRWFAARRTPGWNDLTNVMSLVANTGTIITTMICAAIIYWLISRRMREAVALIAGVSGQALVFLCTTLLIDRPRPQVPKLDVSPPTSSFPSGHTGAASALYFGLVILCLTRLESKPLKVVAAIGFGVIPFLVATARMYRGMHHPSDVIFGLLNGIVCAVIAHRAMKRD